MKIKKLEWRRGKTTMHRKRSLADTKVAACDLHYTTEWRVWVGEWGDNIGGYLVTRWIGSRREVIGRKIGDIFSAKQLANDDFMKFYLEFLYDANDPESVKELQLFVEQ